MGSRRILSAIALSAIASATGCAGLIGAGFDDAHLAPSDDGGPSATNPDVVQPPQGTDGNVAPPVDASAGEAAAGDASSDGGVLDSPITCEAGVGATACTVFTGMYELQDPDCHGNGTDSTCRHPDPFTDACACPIGSATTGSMNLLQDCENGDFFVGEVDFCQVIDSAPVDYAGAYQVVCTDSTCAKTACTVPNSFADGCSCPGSSAPITFNLVFDNGTAGQMTICYNPTAPVVTFAGAFQDNGGTGCLVPNPETGACTCPGAVNAFNVRVLTDTVNLNPSQVWACIPGQ